MATEDPAPPEGAQDIVSTNNSDDDDFDLEPGDEVIARLLNITPKETDYGESAVLTLETEDDDVVDLFARDEVKQAYKQDSLERGETYWIACMNDTREVNGTEFHPTKIRKLK